MGMRVDQAWKHGYTAEVDLAGLRVRRRAPSDGTVRAIGDDAAAVHDNPAVGNGRFDDGHDPGGVVPDHRRIAGLQDCRIAERGRTLRYFPSRNPDVPSCNPAIL